MTGNEQWDSDTQTLKVELCLFGGCYDTYVFRGWCQSLAWCSAGDKVQTSPSYFDGPEVSPLEVFDLGLHPPESPLGCWVESIPQEVLSACRRVKPFAYELARCAALFPEARSLLKKSPILLALLFSHCRRFRINVEFFLALLRLENRLPLRFIGINCQGSVDELLSNFTGSIADEVELSLIPCYLGDAGLVSSLCGESAVTLPLMHLVSIDPSIVTSNFFHVARQSPENHQRKILSTFNEISCISGRDWDLPEVDIRQYRHPSDLFRHRLELELEVGAELSEVGIEVFQYGLPEPPGGTRGGLEPVSALRSLLSLSEKFGDELLCRYDDIYEGRYCVYQLKDRALVGVEVEVSGELILDRILLPSPSMPSRELIAEVEGWLKE